MCGPALNWTMNNVADDIKRNVNAVHERMAAACREAGRSPEDVSLCAVTKTRTAEQIQALLDAGVRIIGENRVQEARDKFDWEKRNFDFHFIGHLQTNKARQVVEMFDMVQSVDSVKLAKKISEEAVRLDRTIKILVQVNSSGEKTKSGFEPGELLDAAVNIMELPNLELRGVMTIGPFTNDEAAIRKSFVLTRSLFEELRKSNPAADILSMGMTDDLEIAISEGATLVRVGRALFQGR